MRHILRLPIRQAEDLFGLQADLGTEGLAELLIRLPVAHIIFFHKQSFETDTPCSQARLLAMHEGNRTKTTSGESLVMLVGGLSTA